MARLARREDERRRLVADLARLTDPTPIPAPVLRTQLEAFLSEWRALLTEGGAEARSLLTLVLDGQRMAFRPAATGYQLTVPIAFDRVLSAAVPDLQDRVASLTGFEPVLPP